MGGNRIDPWSEPASQDGWALPEGALKPDRARELYAGLRDGAPASLSVHRALALARRLGQSLIAAWGSDDRERTAELIRLGSACSQFVCAASEEAPLAEPLMWAAIAEANALGIEFREFAAADPTDTIAAVRARMDGPADEPEEKMDGCDPWSYRCYALGRRERALGRPVRALRYLGEGLHVEKRGAEARTAILSTMVELRWRLKQSRKLEAENGELLALLEGRPACEFDLSLAHHYRALGAYERERWPEVIDAARESNLRLFRFGAVQSSRRIGVNTFMTARGLGEQREWGEAALLAGLSLKALHSWEHWPSRGEAALLAIEAKRRIGDREGARQLLRFLMEQIPRTPDQSKILEKAEAMAHWVG